jgi:hypothetical protein
MNMMTLDEKVKAFKDAEEAMVNAYEFAKMSHRLSEQSVTYAEAQFDRARAALEQAVGGVTIRRVRPASV